MKARTRLTVVVGASALLAALANAEPPKPKLDQKGTGFDIKAQDIRTTGPKGSPPNAPIFVFKNVGRKKIERSLRFRYWTNGTYVGGRTMSFNLKPGFSAVFTGGPVDANFARFGDTVEVFVDSDQELREDNEVNNRRTEKLGLQLVPRPR